jgi:N-acetylglucosamine-6-phosphate deacetylase
MTKERYAITAAAIFDGEAVRENAAVIVEDEHIAAVMPRRDLPAGLALRAAPDGAWLAPGFIDVQVNGGGGVLLNDDPSLQTIGQIAATHRRFGTTGLLPTLITDHADRLESLFGIARQALAVPGVLGCHLEGPHLNPARKGIHPPAHIRIPDAHDLEILAAFGAIGRSQVTLAPECVASTCVSDLVAAGLRISVGHSNASYGVVAEAADQGLTGVTHLFNAMSQITAREPGVVGAALADDRLFAGIICDGFHVDPINLRLAFQLKGPDQLMLVTDAMPSVGDTRGAFKLHGRPIRLHGGRLTDADGTLAGAHLSMIEAVGNAVTMMGVTLEDALTMASLTPARFLGLEHERGQIITGHRADLVALDGAYQVIDTWIEGV